MTATIKYLTAKEIKKHARIYDLFIIGAGPCGLTAALYAARAKLDTAFIEKNIPGGKLIKTAVLENYSGFEEVGGIDLATKMHQQIKNLKIDEYFGEISLINFVDPYWIISTNDGEYYYSRTVFIATGMKEKTIGILGEVENYGKGVSYCAICDGSLYKNHEVVVIGGGNSALDEAMYLADIVQKVHLVHRRYEFRGDAITVEKVKQNSKIELHLNYLPQQVMTNYEGVYGLRVKSNDSAAEEKIIHAKCIFIYVGLLPENQFIPNNIKIFDNELGGFIDVNQDMKTKYPGLYAGGDIINKSLRQVITACNDGAIGAIAIKYYLTNEFKE